MEDKARPRVTVERGGGLQETAERSEGREQQSESEANVTMLGQMKPKTAAERAARLDSILQALDQRYPTVTCALHHGSAWELLVATILSAQCTDERVNKVTPGLFRKYPTMRDFAAAPQEEIAREVHSTGFFNNKAKSIRGAAQKLLAEFGGEIPRDIDKLLTVPGAARKTANVVLGTAFGIPSGVVVDTHVARISNRLGMTKEKDPVKIERDLMKALPRERWIQFSHQIIHFGREICEARKPKCIQCPIEKLCYSKDKQLL
jgi:endonuclease-3